MTDGSKLRYGLTEIMGICRVGRQQTAAHPSADRGFYLNRITRLRLADQTPLDPHLQINLLGILRDLRGALPGGEDDETDID
jgi:hypothetical protein